MAGTTEGLGRGSYQLTKAPPLFVVSDVHDGLVPYADAVAVFNQARGPKALLALHWDSSSDSTGSTAHMAASGVIGPTSGPVIKSTTDFFNAFLKHEHGALQAVSANGHSSLSVVHAAWTPGSRATLPVPEQAAVHLHASVTPNTGLHDGETVTVRWSGYTPGKVVNILECSQVDIATASSAGCSFLMPRSCTPTQRVLARGPPRWYRSHRQRRLRRSTLLPLHSEQRQLDQPRRYQGAPHPLRFMTSGAATLADIGRCRMGFPVRDAQRRTRTR